MNSIYLNSMNPKHVGYRTSQESMAYIQ